MDGTVMVQKINYKQFKVHCNGTVHVNRAWYCHGTKNKQ